MHGDKGIKSGFSIIEGLEKVKRKRDKMVHAKTHRVDFTMSKDVQKLKTRITLVDEAEEMLRAVSNAIVALHKLDSSFEGSSVQVFIITPAKMQKLLDERRKRNGGPR